MTDRDLTAVLERAVDALSPRDPDPVGAVLRRVKARRRRVLAATTAGTLAVAALGTAGALALTGREGSGAVPATGPVRHVERWSGETVSFRGVNVPVPDGWTTASPVGRPAPTSCTAPGWAPVEHTIYTLPSVPAGPAGPFYLCDSGDVPYVTVEPATAVASNPAPRLEIDPSGQPVWTVYQPWARVTTMELVWSGVTVHVWGTDPDEALAFLAGVRAAREDHDATGLTLPRDMTAADVTELPGPGHPDFDGFPSNGRDLRAGIEALVQGPATELTCVPAPGRVARAMLTRTADGPGERRFSSLTFDRTGSCDLVFDDAGGLVRMNGAALHRWLKSHSLNPTIPKNPPAPSDPITNPPH